MRAGGVSVLLANKSEILVDAGVRRLPDGFTFQNLVAERIGQEPRGVIGWRGCQVPAVMGDAGQHARAQPVAVIPTVSYSVRQ